MFKKLHSLNEDSQYTLNQDKKGEEVTYKKSFVKSGTSRRKNSSYGEKFRKKNHLLPQVPQLEIVESDTFIFQGRMASVVDLGSSLVASGSEKHGEGVMFLKNGTLIVGFWDHGLLHGRSIIFTPFGGRTIAQFYNGTFSLIRGRLNGWAITLFSDKLVVCARYYDNKIDGEKIIFQANEQMWVGSRYSEQTKSFKIIHVEKGKLNELPDFLKLSKSADLMDLYEDFVNHDNCCMTLKEIQFVSLTENLSYIGYGNEECHPNGMGAIYGKNEFYLGHFREGSLECYGRMIFDNGQIYQGQLLNGVFYGQGVYYNPGKNLSTIMSTNRDEQKILDEQDGYICINPQLNYFKYHKQGQTGMVGDALASICEIVEKYYSRSYIENRPQSSLDSGHTDSEFGISENVDESVSKTEEEMKKKQSPRNLNLDSEQDKRWLNFNSKQSAMPDQKSFQASGYEQNESNRYRAFSVDKREASRIRNHLAEQSMPPNFQDFNNYSNIHDKTLEEEFNKLKLNRNFTSGERERKATNVKFPDSTKAKENIHPKEIQNLKESNPYASSNLFEVSHPPDKNAVKNHEKGQFLSTQQAMTFRNKNLAATDFEQKVERKFSEMVETKGFSPSSSVISNLSHKVEGMISKTGSKRKKIFM